MSILSALSDLSADAVDWWFIYKFPEGAVLNGSQKTTGQEYLYFDSSSTPALAMSKNRIGSATGALDRTLNLLSPENRAAQKSLGWILYNDEKPDRSENSGEEGHSKGVLIFDRETDSALWLLHSWPCFPSLRGDPPPSLEYGQTFLCVTLRDFQTAEQIAEAVYHQNEPQVYDFRTDGLASDSPLYKLARNSRSNDKRPPSDMSFQSRAGYEFRFLAKNRHWDEDFWIDWVGPRLGVNLDVESWRRGKLPGTEDSDETHQVADALYINLEPLGVDCEWHYTKDHAKWAVSLTDDWVCAADINRQTSQEKRGGGTICFQHAQLWRDLSRIVRLKNSP